MVRGFCSFFCEDWLRAIYLILVFLLPENYQFETYFRTEIKLVSLSSFNIVTQILIGNYFDSDYYRQCQLN